MAAFRSLLAAGTLALCAATGAHAQEASPYAIDIPPWFAETFLDFREDIADAAKDGKRLMVYFGQDGCPYCKQLMVTNFSQRRIVDKTRRHFVAVALNIWGDREVTWLDGRAMTRKGARPRARRAIHADAAVLRREGRRRRRGSTATIRRTSSRRCSITSPASTKAARRWPTIWRVGAREPASAALHDEPFFLGRRMTCARTPAASRWPCSSKRRDCAACDELHRDGFRRAEVSAQLARFDVARFGLGARTG